MDAPTIVAATGVGALVSSGVRWVVDRRAAKRQEPAQDVSLLSKAAAAIGEASATLILPLQKQLVLNGETIRGLTEKVEAVEAVVDAVLIRENECQERLAALEAQSA